MEAKDTIVRVRKQAFKEYQETHFLAKEPYFTTKGCQEYIDAALFKVGYKQSRDEMDIQLASLADLCFEHRKAGREEGLERIKGEIEKVENDYRDDDDLAQYLAFNKAKQKILALFKDNEE